MYRKDRIKGIVALILFGTIGISYWILGEEFTKWIAIVAIGVWLMTIYILNRKEKNKE